MSGGGVIGTSSGAEKWKAVHLLRAEEVKSLFGDVVEGLAFLVSRFHVLCKHILMECMQHDKSILHLDLKPGNVLLTWDEGKLMYAFFTFSFIHTALMRLHT